MLNLELTNKWETDKKKKKEEEENSEIQVSTLFTNYNTTPHGIWIEQKKSRPIVQI